MKSINKAIATGVLGIGLILGAPSIPQTNSIATASQTYQNDLRMTVLSYLSQPKFSNIDLLQQISNTEAEFQMLNLNENMIYFSIPKEDYTDKTLEELSIAPDSTEFATTKKGKFQGRSLKLGSYVLRKPGNYFFRIPANKFRVDETDVIEIDYPSTTYSINMEELQDFADNISIYAGHLNVDAGIDSYGTQRLFSNHGAFIAKPEESSLERLVNSLTTDSANNEKKAQQLLDFVTKELEYNYTEANSQKETLKRPNEVLMTGGSDCSGKVILYSSLLEQAGIGYKLLYCDDHITVAVEGDYPNINRLGFSLGNKNYSIAETTASGFQIGKHLVTDFSLDDINYIQDPGKNSKIYDVQTGKPLPFF